MIIDLHGLTEQEAVGEILTGIMSFESDTCDFVEFITGRGEVLTRVVEEMLEKERIE